MTIFPYSHYCIHFYEFPFCFHSRYYTGVTVTDREVKTGTQTTLTCSLTEVTVEVEITWWDGENQITNSKKILFIVS